MFRQKFPNLLKIRKLSKLLLKQIQNIRKTTLCSLYITVAVCSEIYKSSFGVCTHLVHVPPPPLSTYRSFLSLQDQDKTVEMLTAPTQGETWLLHEDTNTQPSNRRCFAYIQPNNVREFLVYLASRDIITTQAQNDKPRSLPPPNLKPGVSPVVQVIVDLHFHQHEALQHS